MSSSPGNPAGPDSPATTKPTRSNRTLWLILAACLAPVVMSYFTYYVLRPGAGANYGELLPTTPISGVQGRTTDGRNWRIEDMRGKWLMVVVDGPDCQQACRDKLLVIRQLRLMQGKDQERIQRLWLVPGEVAPAEITGPLVEGMTTVLTGQTSLEWLPVAAGAANRQAHIYLMDPLGNLMMRYPAVVEPKRMSKDLGRLLKASQIG